MKSTMSSNGTSTNNSNRGMERRKDYWWCDNEYTRAVKEHLLEYLRYLPLNGVFIKGVEKQRRESIEINSIIDSNTVNIRIYIADIELRDQIASEVYLLMESAFINEKIYTIEKTDKEKNTLILTLTWQPLDKKSKPSEH